MIRDQATTRQSGFHCVQLRLGNMRERGRAVSAASAGGERKDRDTTFRRRSTLRRNASTEDPESPPPHSNARRNPKNGSVRHSSDTDFRSDSVAARLKSIKRRFRAFRSAASAAVYCLAASEQQTHHMHPEAGRQKGFTVHKSPSSTSPCPCPTPPSYRRHNAAVAHLFEQLRSKWAQPPLPPPQNCKPCQRAVTWRHNVLGTSMSAVFTPR
jgi:hypothetical protein